MEIDLHFIKIPFSYVRDNYGVPAEMYREVIVAGKKGVIIKDMGHHIGVYFYERQTYLPSPCHPTWEVEYLETFNSNPPIPKMTASKKRYMEYIDSDSGLTFGEWLGIKPKKQIHQPY